MLKSIILFILAVMIWSVPMNVKAQIFEEPDVLTVFLDEGSLKRINTADLNGDSLIDVFVSAAQPDLYWFENLGNNLFSFEQEIYEGSVFGESAAALDVDMDGDQDLISAESFASEIVLLLNNGDGTFQEAVEIEGNLDPIDDMILADLDRDGRQDILFSAFDIIDDIGRVYWMRNFGFGNFGSRQTIADEAFEVKKLAVADLDNDGYLDVISGSYWDFRLNWFRNEGNGTFSDEIEIRSPLDSIRNFCVFTADMDGDGDIDIINGRERAPQIIWYENNGEGSFIVKHTISETKGCWDIVAADFDLDGDQDLFTGFSGTEEIAWFENPGNGQFEEPIIFANGISVLNDIHVADIDGDWDMDVFAASTLDHQFLFFENHRLDCTPLENHIEKDICDNEVFTFGNTIIQMPGTYTYASPNTLDCDSVFILHATIQEGYLAEVYDTIVHGGFYTLPNGDMVNMTGTYTTVLEGSASECDSIITVHLYVDEMVSASGDNEKDQVSIYPNPTTGEINLDIGDSFIEGLHGQVENLMGQVIYTFEINEEHFKTQVNIPSGVYVMVIRDMINRVVSRQMLWITDK